MKLTDEGTDSLFQQYPIKEIQEIERKLRNDIEKKKEDLRQMVGERYQDLMNAADTITEMKISADSVTSHIKAMEDRCCSIYNRATPSGILQKSFTKSTQDRKPLEAKFILGSQLKIIMDMPILFWSCVDENRFTDASEMYLLSQYVASSLSYNPAFQLEVGQTLNSAFPAVASQIAQIGKYRYTVLQNCRDFLKKEDLNYTEMTDILCSLLLLDNASLLDILQQFFNMRMAALDHILKLDKDDSTISCQVCDVVSLICNTIQLVEKVFHSEESENSLLLSTYYALASENIPGPISHFCLENSTSYSYMPENIKAFRSTLNGKLTPLSPQHLKTACKKWLSNVTALVQLKLKSLLNYVSSIKGVAAVCQSIDERFQQFPSKDWSFICNSVLDRNFNPYEDLLKPVITERIMALLSAGLKSSFSICKTSLQELLNNLQFTNRLYDNEKNLTEYIWAESASDFAIQPGWLTQNPTENFGTLAMKACGYTPQVQILCGEFDSRISELLVDLESFCSLRQISNENNLEIMNLHLFVKDVTNQELNALLNFIEAIIENQTSEQHLLTWNPTIGRFCRALCELSPSLKLCFSCKGISKDNNDTEWQQMSKNILKTSEQSLRNWIFFVVDKEMINLEKSLELCDPSCMLQSILAWDEIEINEETEDGTSVKSTIRVPLQASSFLQSTLMKICQDINKTVGHSLPKTIIGEAGLKILSRCLTIYCLAANQLQAQENVRFIQNFALQLLFDVQFLSSTFSNKNDSEIISKLDEAVTRFEGMIDPFDLDVFNPALQKNLALALHKSSLLLGLLFADRLSSGSFQGPQTQPSNLLLSCGGVARFQLLPTSAKSEKSLVSSDTDNKNTPPKMARSYGSSPSLSSSSDLDSVSKSSSFYDRFSAMGASWFGSNQ